MPTTFLIRQPSSSYGRYSWNTRTFSSVCFDYSPARQLKARQDLQPNSDQCVDDGVVGPFLFPPGAISDRSRTDLERVSGRPQRDAFLRDVGAFGLYSRPAAAALASSAARSDEARLLQMQNLPSVLHPHTRRRVGNAGGDRPGGDTSGDFTRRSHLAGWCGRTSSGRRTPSSRTVTPARASSPTSADPTDSPRATART